MAKSRIIRLINSVTGRKDPETKRGRNGRNGHKGNGKQNMEALQDARTVVVNSGVDPAVLAAVQRLEASTKAIIDRQNTQDIIGEQGKIILANAVIKPLPGTELRMTRVSRRTANLLAADITESALFSDDASWPRDAAGNKMDPAEVWRTAMINLSVSIQGHQFDKVSNLAGLQGGDNDEQTDNKYIGR